MKKLLFAPLFILIFSCTETSKSEEPPIVDNVIDNKKFNIESSLRSGRDIVDEIFSALVKKDPELKSLDDRISKIYKEAYEVADEYDKIINQSENYYKSAFANAKNISDSMIIKEMEIEIKTSEEKYEIKIKPIKDLIKSISKNNEDIKNQYIALKIKKTLPEIEKYQENHPLKTDSLQNLVKKQEKLISDLKNFK